MVTRQPHGTAPRLVCPYHQWTYRLDGQLMAARDMGEEFDRSQYGLRPIHCARVGLFNFPSTWNHGLGDHAVSFRLLPINPTETQLTTKWLVHADAVEGAICGA